ncbi:MAG: hypothetical protein QM500_10910 [Methylococcales bacterium]
MASEKNRLVFVTEDTTGGGRNLKAGFQYSLPNSVCDDLIAKNEARDPKASSQSQEPTKKVK